ncbi:glycogen synthase GlgA [Caldimonas tepidiphila]|uniref:glycogen synthase GlgA n=1 Tax=Caldimonas tepidiphila TaxID=2315841 RepID=UPI000E5B04EF|nr:glycogen synthase GlgA [Caldimonas tepidiphila]
MRVLHVCAEMAPLLKTGGLADVSGALPAALARHGCEARVLLPGFPAIRAGLGALQTVARLDTPWGTAALLHQAMPAPGGGVGVYVIDAPQLYDRPGNPYADAAQNPYGDNHRRFALLGWLAAQLAQGLDPYWRAELVHAHDWHAGLAPAYLRAAAQSLGRRVAASVFTVHNLAYQGMFAAHHFGELALPGDFFRMDGLEFHGQLGFLKAGLFYADRLTTVSPSYAREIQTPEQGCGLDGLLRSRRHELSGILNGVDDTVWNPATDALIPARYDVEDLSGKAACKAALQREFGLAPAADAPLFAVVSRLTEQKGLQLVLDGLPGLLARGGQLLVLGSGDAALEAAFRHAAGATPRSVAVRLGYDEALSHRIYAGADVMLVPSRFEPCGLTQLYGLKYGSLPLVRRVGGLADTVNDSTLEDVMEGRATGFVFGDFAFEPYMAAMRRAFALYHEPAWWQRVQRNAMRQAFDWDAAAAQYAALYRQIL